MKVNFDVGYFEPDKYQVAVVARKCGRLMHWMEGPSFFDQPSVVVGEARSALEGVRMALEHSWHEIVIEGDNSELLSVI